MRRLSISGERVQEFHKRSGRAVQSLDFRVGRVDEVILIGSVAARTVGMILTSVNPASRASPAMYSAPCGKLRFSAAIDARAIQSCSRFTFLSCILGIWARTAPLSSGLALAANTGAAASTRLAAAACTNSRLLDSKSLVSAMNLSREKLPRNRGVRV